MNEVIGTVDALRLLGLDPSRELTDTEIEAAYARMLNETAGKPKEQADVLLAYKHLRALAHAPMSEAAPQITSLGTVNQYCVDGLVLESKSIRIYRGHRVVGAPIAVILLEWKEPLTQAGRNAVRQELNEWNPQKLEICLSPVPGADSLQPSGRGQNLYFAALSSPLLRESDAWGSIQKGTLDSRIGEALKRLVDQKLHDQLWPGTILHFNGQLLLLPPVWDANEYAPYSQETLNLLCHALEIPVPETDEVSVRNEQSLPSDRPSLSDPSNRPKGTSRLWVRLGSAVVALLVLYGIWYGIAFIVGGRTLLKANLEAIDTVSLGELGKDSLRLKHDATAMRHWDIAARVRAQLKALWFWQQGDRGRVLVSEGRAQLDSLRERVAWVRSQGMIPIPAGCFEMGTPASDTTGYKSPASDTAGFKDEYPQHQVCLSSFLIDTTEVTQLAYQTATGKTPWITYKDAYSTPPAAQIPAYSVDWMDASSFCTKLGKRLPTEAQFEYANRAGSTTMFPWGNDTAEGCKYANLADRSFGTKFKELSTYATQSCDDGHVLLAPVATFSANAWGVYDMAGNVWEWTQDKYDSAYYARSPKNDPQGPDTSASDPSPIPRVTRGGGWGITLSKLRSATRTIHTPESRENYLGFRCVL